MMFRRSPNSPRTQPVVDPQAMRSPWIYRIGGPSPAAFESASASHSKRKSYSGFSDAQATPGTRHRYLSMPRRLPSEITQQFNGAEGGFPRGVASSNNHAQSETIQGSFEAPINDPAAVLKPILKRPTSLSISTEDINHPWSATKPDPRLILSSLSRTFNLHLEDYLDVGVLISLHTRDRLDSEARVKERNSWRTGKPMFRGDEWSGLVVFSEPLHKASIYASSSVVLGGREHDLPIVVVGCVEELYRTGIYQANLFRALPNRARLLELINVFDSQHLPTGSFVKSRPSSGQRPSDDVGFGANTSLHLESTPDICALLSTYLTSLPEPILIPTLFKPLWDWCGLEYDIVDATPDPEESPGRRFSSIPLTRTYTNPVEKSRIAIAQSLLYLLPSPNFSLLVYLLAFFSQVAMVPQENGVGLEDIGRMFGGAVFGGSQTGTRDGSSSSNETVRRPREGETMMCWFLRRWAPISDGLFALVEELESSTAVEQEALVSPDVWKPYRNAQGAVIGTPHPLLGGGSQRPPWASRISSDPIIQTKPDKSNAQLNDYFSITSANQKSNLVKFKDPVRPKDVELHKVGDMLHEEVDYVLQPEPEFVASVNLSVQDVASPSSSVDVCERLQDISLPPSLNSSPPLTFPTGRTSTHDYMDMDHACSRILQLERELEARDVAFKSLQETSHVQANHNLEERRQLAEGSGSWVGDKRALTEALRLALDERDEALKLVAEIRKLASSL